MADPPVLACTALVKRFGERTAVDGISFRIDRGECYGLLGPNGAGKTTTISMACGLLPPSAGQVRVCGTPLRWGSPGAAAEAAEARGLVGYVPQEVALYPELSAEENLRFFGRLYGLSGRRLAARTAEVLDIVGLGDRGRDKVGTYSGGMKRRANIAAGLLHQPRLLVLDEPTVGVDPQSRNAILETMAELGRGGLAVLYTTHYMEEAARLCRRIGIIDGGRLVAEGTLEELTAGLGGGDRVRLRGASDPAALARACAGLPGARAVTCSGGTVELATPCASRLLPLAVAAAAEAGVEVAGAEVVRPSLEDVFLALTGKELRD